MKEILYAYNFDIYVGRLCYNSGVLSFIVDNDSDELAQKAIRDKGLNQGRPGLLWLNLVEERIVPPNRQNIAEILQRLGLQAYDPWEIFKRVNGFNINDVFWVSVTPVHPSTFWDIHTFPLTKSKKCIKEYKERQKHDGYDILKQFQ